MTKSKTRLSTVAISTGDRDEYYYERYECTNCKCDDLSIYDKYCRECGAKILNSKED